MFSRLIVTAPWVATGFAGEAESARECDCCCGKKMAANPNPTTRAAAAQNVINGTKSDSFSQYLRNYRPLLNTLRQRTTQDEWLHLTTQMDCQVAMARRQP